MKESLLSVLRCPATGESLQLVTIKPDVSGEDRVETGILWAPESGYWYPVVNYVPVMLTFSTPLVQTFSAHYKERLASLRGARLPSLDPMPGERSVQKTFTEEWAGLADDQLTFVYTYEELVALHRNVWLRMSEDEFRGVRRVANVGVGFGMESVVLSEIFPNAEIFAIDLNLALVKAGESLKMHGRVSPVVASLFHLPFASATFDHVHSQGVIHHTYSTKDAFDKISALVKPRGSLFVWVYAVEDAYVVKGLRGFAVWTYWFISHRLIRPVLSRAPAYFRQAAMYAFSLILHPFLKARSREGWRFVNTLHGLRDAFTPRYAHQHGFNEVLTWFEEAGFDPRLQSPLRYRNLMKRRLLGIGILGRRG